MVPDIPDTFFMAMCVWAIVSIVYFVIGIRQVIAAVGTVRRLLWVAPLAAAVAAAPVWAWAFSVTVLSVGVDKPLVFGVAACSCCWMAFSMRPPLKPIPVGFAQILVLDEGINASIARVAASMGIAPPRLRIQRMLGGADKIMAFVGGLPQPSLVVTEGTLHRLAPEERDAILAT